ncbi:MAG: single-stranded-DNA-specific exonuclease RecJ, partial [Spirochaetaceae bacterium]|nr:single-stranded-DNA-specific exonuclease RecJ [Spirochaetaceae bacterium]
KADPRGNLRIMKWEKEDLNQTEVRELSKRYSIGLLDASIFARRKITLPGQLLYYLKDDLWHLHDPFLFTSMEDAVDRILLALDENEKVLIFGDSDADGVTATALLFETLKDLQLNVSFRVPEGEEPYGLSMAAVDDFAKTGGTLIVTVDCGISNYREIERANELGVDVIICDHHKLQSEEPPHAVAVIDPKIPRCGYPFRDLAGAGVAYKLSWALRFAQSGFYKQSIALLNLSIVEDKKETEASRGKPLRWLIEAVKLNNLVETARFSQTIDTGDAGSAESHPGVILQALADFLQGRSIFVWHQSQQNAIIREIFGRSVEIQSYDLSGDAGCLNASLCSKALEDIGTSLGIGTFSSETVSDIDVLVALFTRIAMQKAGLLGKKDEAYLQLAALGTIADLMPLKDENRIIVRRGVASMNDAPRNGLKELKASLRIEKALNATEIAWQITPLINAAGRIGKPGTALQLLISDDPSLREAAALGLQQANSERRKMGSDVWEAIYPLAAESCKVNQQRFVLVGSSSVKSGITGLLASRVVNVFKVPAIIAAFKDDGTIVGSVRAANNLHITEMLAECSELFIDYGGHDAAAGFSMQAGCWDQFVSHVTAFIGKAELNMSEETISIDAELPHKYLKPELYEKYSSFEPFGEGNPPLVFLCRNVSMADAQIIGKSARNHLKLTLDFGHYKWPALLWDGASRLETEFSFKGQDKVDVLFKLSLNRWNGDERPQLELYDIRRSEPESLT